MQVINDYPPNYDKLVAAFPAIEMREVLITIGDKLYNPKDLEISDHVMHHEEVHSKQQLAFEGGVEAYIAKFMADPAFRLEVEAEAYGKQCLFIYRRYGKTRYHQAIQHYAKALAGPAYGNLCTPEEAEDKIIKFAV